MLTSGSYGIGVARFLRRHAVKVVEVSRPPRAGERRLDGKSDPIDAENAARQVLAGRAVTTPKLADGIVEAIRLTRIARNGAVKAHTQAIVTLKATLVTAVEGLRSTLEPLSDFKLMTACAALDTDGEPADPAVAMRHALASIARRWLDLHEEIKLHTKRLDALTAQAAPDLVAAFGIGSDIAGELLVAAGDNTDRVRSDAAFAKLCGVCPIPTGSGKTGGRHRLNRGGNRQANAALYRCVIVRMRWHAPTIAYVTQRTADGLTVAARGRRSRTSSWPPSAGSTGTTPSGCTVTAATCRPPISKQRSTLLNRPTRPWLESNSPSLHQTQGDSLPNPTSR